MSKITVSISPDIIKMFPAITVVGVRASISDPEILTPVIAELQGRAKTIAAELVNVEPITSLPEIACWRDAYSKIGVKPSKFHASIEALLRRLKKGQDIATGLPIVDFYNLVSLTQKSPLGAYDFDKFNKPEITMRCAIPSTDRFDPLGGTAAAFPLNPSLAVYASGPEILCWGFNTRDSQTACVDEGTREVIFFSETVTSSLGASPVNAIMMISDLLTSVGINVEPPIVVDAANPFADI